MNLAESNEILGMTAISSFGVPVAQRVVRARRAAVAEDSRPNGACVEAMKLTRRSLLQRLRKDCLMQLACV